MSSLEREIIHSSAETWKLDFWVQGITLLKILCSFEDTMDQMKLRFASVEKVYHWNLCDVKEIPCSATVRDRLLRKLSTSIELEVIAHCVAYLECKTE